jgi:hypothetical protein
MKGTTLCGPIAALGILALAGSANAASVARPDIPTWSLKLTILFLATITEPMAIPESLNRLPEKSPMASAIQISKAAV